MQARSVFYREWLRSLREQYKHVARNDDRATLPSLTAVMLNAGFREEELARLRLEATMRVDDVGGDFRADMKILDPLRMAQAHPGRVPLSPTAWLLTRANSTPTVSQSRRSRKRRKTTADLFYQSRIIVKSPRKQTRTPVTFEDGLAAEADMTQAADPEAPLDGEDPDDAADPAQMSLF